MEPRPSISPYLSKWKTSVRTVVPKPISADPNLKTYPLQFSFAFAVAGSIGLAIALQFALMRDYWIPVTLVVLLLRSDIFTSIDFTVLRVIGTFIGALMATAVITVAIDIPWIPLTFLFAFCFLYFAGQGLNYGLAVAFLTPFILLLLALGEPSHVLSAEPRIIDTLIGTALAVLTIMGFRFWTAR